jgi:hypothetical protein
MIMQRSNYNLSVVGYRCKLLDVKRQGDPSFVRSSACCEQINVKKQASRYCRVWWPDKGFAQ